MIKSVKLAGATDTHLANLPIHGRTFAFEPGVSVLFGPNGCGKTTLLRLLAAVTSLHGFRSGLFNGLPELELTDDLDRPARATQKNIENRVSRLPDYMFRVLFCKTPSNAGSQKRKTTPLKLTLDWERSPVFFVSGKDAFSTPSFMGQTEYGIVEEVANTFSQGRLSAGQSMLARLERMIAQAQNAQVPYYTKYNHVNSLWQLRCKVWNAWVDRFEPVPNARPTLILDEPDMSLAPIAQQRLWEALAAISRDHGIQIIAASHSPFCLQADNVIEIGDGYIMNSVMAVLQLASKLKQKADVQS